ncbi:MAG: hypothetical protein D6756_01970 [Cyanobacteria bacterium J083]|nr:MAG: hypothetical protein D6756_01970 [Cyanobacteria bacterium J083]
MLASWSILSPLLLLGTVSNVSARPNAPQCLQADVSVQYNISGSRRPAERRNDVTMESEPNCQGNVSVTTGVQGNVGGRGKVIQNRRVHHRHRNSNPDSTGGSTLKIINNVGIDVYNPADNLDY